MSPPLIALFIAAFAFGTTEFVIAGVLPEVAEGLQVGVPTAGYLVSGYALGIAIGGPLLTIAAARVPRRTLIIALTLAFVVGQAACALAPNFLSMLAFRFATAIAHGCFFGVAMVVAVGLVPPAARGRAVAVVLAGLTISNIVGVPAGTAIGNFWGWRSTFWAMFALGIVAAAAAATLLPRKAVPSSEPVGLATETRVLARQQVWTSLIIMLMLMMAQFVPFTYITPMLREVTHLSEDTVPWMLLLIGLGSTLGVFAGGKLADGNLMRWLVVLLLVQAVSLLTVWLASPHALQMAAALFVWGALSFSIGTAVQTRILAWTADAPNLASSLIPSGFNIGIALAASIGAMLLDAGYGYRSLPLVGVAAMVVGAGVALLSSAAERRAGSTPPTAIGQAEAPGRC
ncbi:MAG: MFS transporter [Rhizobiales bacterium 65-79]|jgi:DHA1 family inner membrane transport protein|nr:MFS transporter [Hyphomicrobiales bacterium]OJU02653.1 MAG: MFS transporter [Rhizobiales bacterium 65-79]